MKKLSEPKRIQRALLTWGACTDYAELLDLSSYFEDILGIELFTLLSDKDTPRGIIDNRILLGKLKLHSLMGLMDDKSRKDYERAFVYNKEVASLDLKFEIPIPELTEQFNIAELNELIDLGWLEIEYEWDLEEALTELKEGLRNEGLNYLLPGGGFSLEGLGKFRIPTNFHRLNSEDQFSISFIYNNLGELERLAQFTHTDNNLKTE